MVAGGGICTDSTTFQFFQFLAKYRRRPSLSTPADFLTTKPFT